MNPPRNRKGETGSPLPKANASEFYPNQMCCSASIWAALSSSCSAHRTSSKRASKVIRPKPPFFGALKIVDDLATGAT